MERLQIVGQVGRRLGLGVGLIVVASAILLWSDAPRRAPISAPVRSAEGASQPARVLKVALMQAASQTIIDEGADGVVAGLKECGFVEGTNLKLSRFNAEGDMATSNAMASELTGGAYDLIITLTTSSLQAVANANKQRKIPHVFGLVTDPVKAGVGIGTEPLDHPPHMVGLGTLQPVAESLRLAQQFNPKISKVGIAWNPAEINSEVCTKLARAACQELKLEVIEATVENSAAVNESVASLIGRNVDVLWVGGDVTVMGAFDLVAKAARNAHIPVCTCIPGNVPKGSLFDLGANYFMVGQDIGRLAGRVLAGDEISKLPVKMTIPPKLMLNKVALEGLRDHWSIPDEMFAKADTVVDETGVHEKSRLGVESKTGSTTSPSAASKIWRLRLIAYVNSPDVEETEKGLVDGMQAAGLIEGRDFEIKQANSQGDMSTLNSMVESAVADQADLLLTVSTQALQAASQRSKGTPIVFTMVANPFSAGVATTDAEHLPNLSGAYGANDVDSMMPLIKQVMPDAHRVGALYPPNEVNAVYAHGLLVKAAKTAGYELVSVGVSSASEATDATQSLCGQQIDLICLPNSNLAASSFPTIMQPLKRAKIPLFGFLGSMAPQGALLVLTRDYYDMGCDSGQIAARVIKGEKPAAIPLHQCRKTKLIINQGVAKSLGLVVPESLLKSADRVIE